MASATKDTASVYNFYFKNFKRQISNLETRKTETYRIRISTSPNFLFFAGARPFDFLLPTVSLTSPNSYF